MITQKEMKVGFYSLSLSDPFYYISSDTFFNVWWDRNQWNHQVNRACKCHVSNLASGFVGSLLCSCSLFEYQPWSRWFSIKTFSSTSSCINSKLSRHQGKWYTQEWSWLTQNGGSGDWQIQFHRSKIFRAIEKSFPAGVFPRFSQNSWWGLLTFEQTQVSRFL